MIFNALSVSVPDDDGLDHGEGSLSFHWSDLLYGDEGLQIDPDGCCSRMMPFRSGQGPPEVIELVRDRLRLRFSPTLAKKLELDVEVEIIFVISGEEFERLTKFIDSFP